VNKILKRATDELSYRFSAERLDSVHLALTYRSNLACRTCGSWRIGKDQQPFEMTLSEVLAVVDQMPGLGVRDVSLVGSEVLLFEGWRDVIGRIRSYGIECSMLTNGSLVDETVAADLMGAHPSRVTVSLDGDEAAHDKLRGKKSFERAMRGVALLADARARISPETGIGMHMTISHLNVHAIRAASDICVERGLDLSFQPASYASQELIDRSFVLGEKAATNRFRPANGMGITSEDLVELRRVYAELTKLGRSYPSLLLIMSLPPDKIARGEYPIGACQTTRHELVVEPDGRVITCANVDAFTIGNVREQSLGEIWESERRRELTKALRGKDAPAICVTCCNFRTNVTMGTNVRAAVRYAIDKAAIRRQVHAAAG
jgi:radical SAM protein with 4Fe4S-binding SPASM domain